MAKNFLGALIILGVGIISMYVLFLVRPGLQNSDQQTVEKYPDYARLVESADRAGFQELKIVDSTGPHLNMASSSKDFDGVPKVSYRYNRSGARVTDAYLLFEGYVNGSKKSGETLYPDDSLYFKINSFGGHLISTQGRVETPQDPGMTRWMFNLGNMAFYETAVDKALKIGGVLNADFIKYLNSYALPPYKANVFSAIVSSRPTTKIIRLSIFYKMAQEGDFIEKA
ncbi:hypothetical protein A3K24_02885 [candidate division Kazan bacterium RIFCSPHIGHO2_01_FULL_44_14]|uniref:Uncharacterized protein n=1 Tax=candidate division Kazan bacterium RIFCSPLOWO2_01_FULL_45_19 TaxID=1798538 RepID=A0A1F4NQR3_UNCK3|nr:hypothetical protein [uncultured bacterium]OGB73751.1 MAG: hypothetical protein A3K51_02885 [candidate division Kazan bacterium RIFCSPLOWO2_01_FULL_45_19]OGB77996.1 MAG: hypothetical protein A3K24_02885 [candidate division Kazan bacterium RIFCSPHIGHO2_01_FULL_44_14]